jgi:hypothetical protein
MLTYAPDVVVADLATGAPPAAAAEVGRYLPKPLPNVGVRFPRGEPGRAQPVKSPVQRY